MEKYFVADSYADGTTIGEPFENEKGKMYIKIRMACPRCGGSGNYSYNSLDGTMCYGCFGAGTITKTVRAYTEKEYNRMKTANERAHKRKEEAREAKIRDLQENAETYKHELALKMGFGEDMRAYLVYGDDTYSIKDELRKMGARFDPTLKWYFPKEVDLPVGYHLYPFSFDELYNYNPLTKWAEFKENAKDIVKRKMAELKGPSKSEYYPAAVKDRIRNITARVTNICGFEGAYGYTNVYTFESGNYVFVWMTQKGISNLSVGAVVDLTGTIKKFEEYEGVKNTHLTRCSVVIVEG